MKYTRALIALALMVVCVAPCSAAQKKKGILAEKWAKDKSLTYFDDFAGETMYIYNATMVKVAPVSYMPQFNIGKEKNNTTTPRVYTFWANSILKPTSHAKRSKDTKNAAYVKTKWEVGCEQNTYHVQKMIYYSASNAVVKDVNLSSVGAEEAPPDTVASTIISRVCSIMASTEAWQEAMPVIPANPLDQKPDVKQ